MVIFIWNNAVVVDAVRSCLMVGLKAELKTISEVVRISDNIQIFTMANLREIWKLLKYFDKTITSASNVLLLIDMLPICGSTQNLLLSFHYLPHKYYHYFYEHYHKFHLYNNSINSLIS